MIDRVLLSHTLFFADQQFIDLLLCFFYDSPVKAYNRCLEFISLITIGFTYYPE